MRHVRQTNKSSGCGPACVAIVANVAEMDALKVMFPDGRTRGLRSFWPDLRRALAHFSVKHAERPLRKTKWERIKQVSIVGCGRRLNRAGEREWHWVVYEPTAELVYDPLHSQPVPLKSVRRQPFSYLPVEPK